MLTVRKIDDKDLEMLREISIKTFTETFADVNSEEDMQQYISESLNEERLFSELKNTALLVWFRLLSVFRCVLQNRVLHYNWIF